MIEFQVKDILKTIKYLKFIGNEEAKVTQLISLDRNNKNSNALFWCSDTNIDSLDELTKGTVICSELVFKKSLSTSCNYIVVENPRLRFSEVINKLFSYPEITGLSETAKVSKTVQLGHQVSIGEHVVLGETRGLQGNIRVHDTTMGRLQVRQACLEHVKHSKGAVLLGSILGPSIRQALDCPGQLSDR